MQDRINKLESQIAEIIERLSRVEKRLESSAAEPASAPILTEPSPVPDEVAPMTPGEGSLANAATHLGRTLLIFGGAYFFRALTDFQVLPTLGGIALGAAYALFWLAMAYRTGGRQGQRTTAAFFGIASVLLALPMLVEATTRFQLLSGSLAAVAMTVFCGLALIVAFRRDLLSLAWLTTVSGVLTALILLRMTHDALPFAAFLLLLGLGSLWVIYLRGWKGLHWIGALGADIGVAVVVLLSTNGQWSIDPNHAYALGLILFLVYPISFALRSHIQRRPRGVFEVVQGLLVVGIAFWTASVTSVAGSISAEVLGALSLIMGAGSYALAFNRETRSTRGRNFFFYTTVGLILIAGGSAMVMTSSTVAVTWSLLAVLMAFFSGRYGRVTLNLQCTLLLLAAAVGSGVIAAGYQALTGAGTEVWPTVGGSNLIVAIATVACLLIPVAQRSKRWGVLAGLPQLTVLALSTWVVGGLIVAFLAPAIAGVPGAAANLGALAALRTAVLTISAVTLALSSRHDRWPEARWLAYPVLALVGIKLILEDFPNGRPLTMLIALALVGGALILVAKLQRRTRSETT